MWLLCNILVRSFYNSYSDIVNSNISWLIKSTLAL